MKLINEDPEREAYIAAVQDKVPDIIQENSLHLKLNKKPMSMDNLKSYIITNDNRKIEDKCRKEDNKDRALMAGKKDR